MTLYGVEQLHWEATWLCQTSLGDSRQLGKAEKERRHRSKALLHIGHVLPLSIIHHHISNNQAGNMCCKWMWLSVSWQVVGWTVCCIKINPPPPVKNVFCLFIPSRTFTVKNGACAVCFHNNLQKGECLPVLTLNLNPFRRIVWRIGRLNLICVWYASQEKLNSHNIVRNSLKQYIYFLPPHWKAQKLWKMHVCVCLYTGGLKSP